MTAPEINVRTVREVHGDNECGAWRCWLETWQVDSERAPISSEPIYVGMLGSQSTKDTVERACELSTGLRIDWSTCSRGAIKGTVVS